MGSPRRQLVREVLQRRAADAAADEQRVGDAVRRERAAERAGDVDGVADVELREPLAAVAARLDEQTDAVAVRGEQRDGPPEQESPPGTVTMTN